MLKENTKAPDFELPDQDGVIQKLSDYRGKWVLLYFYPKDNTPGCTKEACAFRDNYASIKSAGSIVIGISPDSEQSHNNFAEKYALNFILLSDTEKTVINAYQAYGEKVFMGRTVEGIYRISYLINPDGKIVKCYDKVKAESHADEVLDDIKRAIAASS